MRQIFLTILISISVISCNNNRNNSGAYGNFDAVTTIISAEAGGNLLKFNIVEGQTYESGTIAGIIDTASLNLSKLQVLAQKNAVSSKSSNILSQIKIIDEQAATLENEHKRMLKLLKDSAATQRQMDELEGKINVMKKQREQVIIQNSSIFDELKVFDAQLDIIKNQILKCYVKIPFKSTVIVKYAEQFETVAPGKPLFKISDLSVMSLKAYVSQTQLPEIKIGQTVKVYIDNKNDKMTEFSGKITFISDKAEFTPKIIQTKEERVNLVYAVKVEVKNNGQIKIGMPAEVKF